MMKGSMICMDKFSGKIAPHFQKYLVDDGIQGAMALKALKKFR